MGSISFQPHTADEKFTVQATSLEDAFLTALQACSYIVLGEGDLARPVFRKPFRITATHLRGLLYDFLNEMIALLDEESRIYSHVENLSFSQQGAEHVLEGVFLGDDASLYEFETVIKNMTYSEMEILQDEDGVSLTVVVDI